MTVRVLRSMRSLGISMFLFGRLYPALVTWKVTMVLEVKILQPSIGLRYNYYVRLAAIWRARVHSEITFGQKRGEVKLVVQLTVV